MPQFIKIYNAKKQNILKDREFEPVNIVVPVSSIIGMMSSPPNCFYQIMLFYRDSENGVAAFYISEDEYLRISKILLED